MSLREWYAGMAMPPLVEKSNKTDEAAIKDIARLAFQIADAMLAAGG